MPQSFDSTCSVEWSIPKRIHVRAIDRDDVRRQHRVLRPQRPDMQVMNAGHARLLEDDSANR
jgi:hypothetical protein